MADGEINRNGATIRIDDNGGVQVEPAEGQEVEYTGPDRGTDAIRDSVNTEQVNNTRHPTGDDDLQSIIDDLGHGGTIKLRANTTYELDSGLSVTYDNFTIEGPRSAVLVASDDFGSDTFIEVGRTDDAANFTATGFTIDGANQDDPSAYGNSNTLEGMGIHVVADEDAPSGSDNEVDVRRSLVMDCHIKNVTNEGIAYWGLEEGRTNHDLQAVAWGNLVEGFDARGIHPHNDHAVVIANNVVRDATTVSDVDGGGNAIRHGYIILGNVVSNVTSDEGIRGSALRSIISNNLVEECNVDEAITTVVGDGGELVIGNFVIDCPNRGITAEAPNDTIVGNRVVNCTDSIRIWPESSGNVFHVHNNSAQDHRGTGLQIVDKTATVIAHGNNFTAENPRNDDQASSHVDGRGNAELLDLQSNYFDDTAQDTIKAPSGNIRQIWNTGVDDATSVEPPEDDNLVYLDDGSNTGDSDPSLRYYDGTSWVDL